MVVVFGTIIPETILISDYEDGNIFHWDKINTYGTPVRLGDLKIIISDILCTEWSQFCLTTIFESVSII